MVWTNVSHVSHPAVKSSGTKHVYNRIYNHHLITCLSSAQTQSRGFLFVCFFCKSKKDPPDSSYIARRFGFSRILDMYGNFEMSIKYFGSDGFKMSVSLRIGCLFNVAGNRTILKGKVNDFNQASANVITCLLETDVEAKSRGRTTEYLPQCHCQSDLSENQTGSIAVIYSPVLRVFFFFLNEKSKWVKIKQRPFDGNELSIISHHITVESKHPSVGF